MVATILLIFSAVTYFGSVNTSFWILL